MDGWLVALITVVAVGVVLAAPLVGLMSRRRWLARGGGTFECSLKIRTTTPGRGWALGLARYSADRLEWFRFFSLSTQPRRTFRRSDVRVVGTREPTPDEAGSLYAGQRIVTLATRTRVGHVVDERQWDLAMGGESMTGLLSWLEAAPPGSAAAGAAAG